MNAEEFRKVGKEMIDYVADYLENIEKRPVLPSVEPGYLHRLIPDHAPEDPEKWEDIFKDIERVIMPGMTHWQHPNFHAYFPTCHSFPSILADLLSAGIASNGFSWITSPAYTELEVTMLDWLAQALQLPSEFLSSGKGGGVIQGTASEATLVALFAARSKLFKKLKDQHPTEDPGSVLHKLVVYTSDQAHSSVEKACLLAAVKCHQVTSDENESMRGDALAAAIAEDKAKGLVPFYVVATLGTTPTCAFDNLQEIGPVCHEADVWLHLDAAYSGCAFICPEFRPLLHGVELADSFNFNPHKWMLVNLDCSTLWFKDKSYIVDEYNVDPVHLKHDQQGQTTDFRHWQIHLGRRFRSLKLWFVFRSYGIKGIQSYIRKHIDLALEFEKNVRADTRFEVTHPVIHGLVCFRLKGSNGINERLVKEINRDARIHLVPSISKGRFFLRFVICAAQTESSHIKFAWDVIREIALKLLNDSNKSD